MSKSIGAPINRQTVNNVTNITVQEKQPGSSKTLCLPVTDSRIALAFAHERQIIAKLMRILPAVSETSDSFSSIN